MKSSSKQAAESRATSNRLNYRLALAREWIIENRADVWEKIEAEAWKKYPAPKGARIYNKIRLPEGLRNGQ